MILQLPGVSSSYQMFSGKCAESGFYTEENYQRGLNATAAFTALIHGDEDFSYVHNVRSFISTWSIADWLLQLLAINEPEQDVAKTPGLGDCQFGLFQCYQALILHILIDYKRFVETVRATEQWVSLPSAVTSRAQAST